MRLALWQEEPLVKNLQRSLFASLSIISILVSAHFPVFATQVDVAGPVGSARFGHAVAILPNGNIVVVDSYTSSPGGSFGAVHLYDGATLTLISSLTGTQTTGFGADEFITVLSNGNFVVKSPAWNGNRGAYTFCNAVTGCSGAVSSANSLVGSTVSDGALSDVTPLTNGNYVVSWPRWNSPVGPVTDVGAVTWCSGTTGATGAVSGVNSLIGTMSNSTVGDGGVTALPNGNYVVASPFWTSPVTFVSNVGAVTWGNGNGGTVGTVSDTNSLVGSTASDRVGLSVKSLANGNYVVSSLDWDNLSPAVANAGAVTWGSGFGGVVGTVTSSNSIVGSVANDQLNTVVTLTSGNYVVVNTLWDNPAPATPNVGAARWASGSGGAIGPLSAANSLIGSTANDFVGSVAPLANGNYIVRSNSWDNPITTTADVGAVTWGNGSTGISGTVSNSNSLIGSSAGDSITATPLTNGNYVVGSAFWDNPSPATANVGAITLGNGTSGTTGVVSAANSIIGSTAEDRVGEVVPLPNGNYVVISSTWDNPTTATENVGAVTWGSGTVSTSGVVSSTNSLVGVTAHDRIGFWGVSVLTNSNYLVRSSFWDNTITAAVDVGAVTGGNGATGTSGTVTNSNSIIGATAGEELGELDSSVAALSNGNFALHSFQWDSMTAADAGAIRWHSGSSTLGGTLSAGNSLAGSSIFDLSGPPIPTSNGNYIVHSPDWDNPAGPINSAGAVTFGSGTGGTVGPVTDGTTGGNSVIGTTTDNIGEAAFDPNRNRVVVGRPTTNTLSLLSFTTTAINDGDVANPTTWNNGIPTSLRTGIVPNGRSVFLSTVVNAGLIHVQCGGSLTGGSNSSYVVGSVRKDFCSAANESFVFPVGSPALYSPVETLNANGTGNLTASVTDTLMPGLTTTSETLSRYWSLDGAGITTDLKFNYRNPDINGNEAAYKLFRRPADSDSLITQYTNASLDAANNQITAFGVSRFSDWGIGGQTLVPTAAQLSVSGRVFATNGHGLRNAIVQLTDASGKTRQAISSSFGHYRFDGIEAGQTVIVSVASKRYFFAPQALTLSGDAMEVDFTPQ